MEMSMKVQELKFYTIRFQAKIFLNVLYYLYIKISRGE